MGYKNYSEPLQLYRKEFSSNSFEELILPINIFANIFNGQRVYTRNHVGILKDEELLFQRPCQGRDKKCSDKPLKRPSQARELHRKWNVAFLKIEQNFITNRFKSKRVDIDEDSKHKQTNKHTHSL